MHQASRFAGHAAGTYQQGSHVQQFGSKAIDQEPAADFLGELNTGRLPIVGLRMIACCTSLSGAHVSKVGLEAQAHACSAGFQVNAMVSTTSRVPWTSLQAIPQRQADLVPLLSLS